MSFLFSDKFHFIIISEHTPQKHEQVKSSINDVYFKWMAARKIHFLQEPEFYPSFHVYIKNILLASHKRTLIK